MSGDFFCLIEFQIQYKAIYMMSISSTKQKHLDDSFCWISEVLAAFDYNRNYTQPFITDALKF